MTRDELIEELKRAPYDCEVKVRPTIHPDYFDGVPPGQCPVEELPVFGITVIPGIVIDCEVK